NADTLQLGRNVSVKSTKDFVSSPFNCDIPAITCGGQAVNVDKNRSLHLIPGTYGAVDLQNGAALALDAGLYTFCSIRTGKHVQITIGGATPATINVRDDVRLENGSLLGPSGSGPLPTLNVGGTSLKVGALGVLKAIVNAPNARFGLGRAAAFTGAACVDQVAGSRNVQLICPTTTTTPTTTTVPTTTVHSTTSTSTSTTTIHVTT